MSDECTCADAAAGDEQPCPYAEDVNNDPDSLCSCCTHCRQECANDI